MKLRRNPTDGSSPHAVPDEPKHGRSRRGSAPVEPPSVAPPVRPEGWQPLGELLMARKDVTASQVNQALMHQSASGKRVGTLLVELGAIDEKDLAEALAEQLSLAMVDLGTETPEAEAIALVPESVARASQCIPMLLADGTLVVAVADPSDALVQQLQALTRLEVTLVVAPASDVRSFSNARLTCILTAASDVPSVSAMSRYG